MKLFKHYFGTKEDYSKELVEHANWLLNDFLERPEVKNILLDMDADLRMYRQVTGFNMSRFKREMNTYLLNLVSNPNPPEAA